METPTKITSDQAASLQDVWVVIPVRNEEASLLLVLQELPQVQRVILANNGSTDA